VEIDEHAGSTTAQPTICFCCSARAMQASTSLRAVAGLTCLRSMKADCAEAATVKAQECCDDEDRFAHGRVSMELSMPSLERSAIGAKGALAPCLQNNWAGRKLTLINAKTRSMARVLLAFS
jgi:hypothetical protein